MEQMRVRPLGAVGSFMLCADESLQKVSNWLAMLVDFDFDLNCESVEVCFCLGSSLVDKSGSVGFFKTELFVSWFGRN